MDQKERIIEETTGLIIENDGDLSLVTARKIADRADVALGLINYHFGNKDNLITECVERIIYKEIRAFVPQEIDFEGNPIEADKLRLSKWAKQVFEFFYSNKSISKVSIIGDFQKNKVKSNSVDMQRGFMLALTSDMDESKKNFIVFTLASVMQTAFLQDNMINARLGFDLDKKEDRERFIESVVEDLFK